MRQLKRMKCVCVMGGLKMLRKSFLMSASYIKFLRIFTHILTTLHSLMTAECRVIWWNLSLLDQLTQLQIRMSSKIKSGVKIAAAIMEYPTP